MNTRVNGIERYKIFDHLLEGVQVIDKNYRYIYVNEAVASQGKSTPEELINHTMMEKYPGIERTTMFKLIKVCLTEQVSEMMLNEFQFPDGSTGFFELRIRPVPEGVLILSLDITEQRSLQKKVEDFNEALEEIVFQRTSELVDSLNREKKLNELNKKILSTILHEIKNPITTIQLNVELINEMLLTSPDKELELAYSQIQEASKQIETIISENLSLQKAEKQQSKIKKEKFNVSSFFEKEISKVQLLFPKKDSNVKYKHDGAINFRTNMLMVQSILSNLVSNALKYSEEEVVVKSSLKDHKLKIQVKDTGIGIPKKDEKKVFDIHFRSENSENQGGSGVGLNIVKRYVDLLRGKIKFTSTQDEGTTFTVYIPETLN